MLLKSVVHVKRSVKYQKLAEHDETSSHHVDEQVEGEGANVKFSYICSWHVL